MTCKDCIHYKVCKIIDMAGIWEKAELCECFKTDGLIMCKTSAGTACSSWDRDFEVVPVMESIIEEAEE